MFTVVFLAGLALAQSGCDTPSAWSGRGQTSMVAEEVSPASSGRSGPAREGAGMAEGIARHAGQFYYVHEGTAQLLVQRTRFRQGYYYDMHKRVVGPAGNFIILADNEMISFSGDRIPVPPGVEYRGEYLRPNTGPLGITPR
jgi:hypothetical protein